MQAQHCSDAISRQAVEQRVIICGRSTYASLRVRVSGRGGRNRTTHGGRAIDCPAPAGVACSPTPTTTVHHSAHLSLSRSQPGVQTFSSGIMSSIIARERQISVRDNRASHLLCSPPACLLADSTQMDATYLTDAASTRKQASTKLKATRNHTCMRAYAGRQEESVPRAGAVVVPCRAGGSGPGDGEISLCHGRKAYPIPSR